MKYEFKEIGLDDYELHYTDKEGKEKGQHKIHHRPGGNGGNPCPDRCV